MRKILIVTILFLTAFSSSISQEFNLNCTELSELIRKSHENQIVLVHLNTNDCSTCMVNLEQILINDENNNIDNVVYFLSGIEKDEKDFYFNKVLNRDSENYSAIVSQDCHKSKLDILESKVYILNDGEIIFDQLLKAVDVNKLHSPKMDALNIQDSITGGKKLNISNTFLLNDGVFKMVNKSSLLCLSTKYQNLIHFDVTTGDTVQTINSDNIIIDYTKITEKFFRDVDDDTATITELTDDLLQKFEITNFSTNFENIFLSAKVRYNKFHIVGIDTFSNVINVPVQIKTNLDFEKFETYVIDGIEELGYSYFSDDILFFDDTVYLKVFKNGEKNLKEKYYSVARFIRKNSNIVFDEFILELPDFFYEKEILYNFSSGNFYKLGNNVFHLYDIYPKIFHLTAKNSIYLPNHAHNESIFDFKNNHFDLKYRNLDLAIQNNLFYLLSKEKQNNETNIVLEVWSEEEKVSEPFYYNEVFF